MKLITLGWILIALGAIAFFVTMFQDELAKL